MTKKKWDEFSKQYDAEKERTQYEPFLQAARNHIDVEFYTCYVCHKNYHLSSDKFDFELKKCVDRKGCLSRGFKHLAKSELFARGINSKEKDEWQLKEYQLATDQQSTLADAEVVVESSDSST